jgi:hypothetical protein
MAMSWLHSRLHRAPNQFLVGLLWGALLFQGAAFGADENSNAASEKRLLADITYLASDELEGRGISTQGINKAADYIAAEFAKAGLKTDLYEGTPFQRFKMPATTKLGPAEHNTLTLIAPASKNWEPKPQETGKVFNTLLAGGSGKFSGPIVFAGYGISAPDLGYDDYEGLDVKGKVVVVIRKEPQQLDANSKFNGTNPSDHSLFTKKIEIAEKKGAAALIVINDPLTVSETMRTLESLRSNTFEGMVKILDSSITPVESITPEGWKKLREDYAKAKSSLEDVEKRIKAGADGPLDSNATQAGPESLKLPVLSLSRARFDSILKDATGKELATIEKEIDIALKPQSAELAGWNLSGETSIVREALEVKNVIGVLEGEGPLADETIVIGAHYDHVGMGGAGSLAPWTRAVHNGADDNASGTCTMIEIARRFASMGKKPNRRIVFIAFTAEESGLIGSKHYCKEPRFPLENTVAMLNLDMVGRVNDDTLIVYGTGTAKEFDGLVDDLNKDAKFKITKKPEGTGPSDHDSFYRMKIPVFHYFSNFHPDYHRPSDDVPLINIGGMRRIADFVTATALKIDANPARPSFITPAPAPVANRTTPNPSPNSSRGGRPYVGAAPDYAAEEGGVLVGAVSSGSPAEKAGVKKGDLIVRFADVRINNVQDYSDVIGTKKAGDKIKVQVKRGSETLDLDLELGQPRQINVQPDGK